MRIKSPAFQEGGRIPERYTCEGENLSPPLDIENVPPETTSLAVIVDDPDAPKGTFVHWLIWNLPASIDRLPEGMPREGIIEGLGATEQGVNDAGEIGWRGPCPPRGAEHRYRFRLHALRGTLTVGPGLDRARLEEAMRDRVLATAELTGTFARRAAEAAD